MILPVLLLSLLAPTAAVPTVETFGPHAGFAKAILERQPIRVSLPPEFWGGPQSEDQRADWLQPVLDSWNNAAGWSLFVQVYHDEIADVTFHTVPDGQDPVCGADAGACTWIKEFTAGEYRFEHCFVEFWPWYPTMDTVAHELGHCLGFVDAGFEPVNGYRGVMMYGRVWGLSPENEFDVASLVAAGYREG